MLACTTDDNNNVDNSNTLEKEWLYTHTALEATATSSTTIVIPFTADIFAFTDRPNREYKYISAEEFVSYWSQDATNSFQFDPPNAVLTSVDDDGVAEVEVVIINASTDGDNITYTIQSPKLTENATFEDVSLFVDGNGDNNLAIGQSYQGGIIAYIDSTGQHGLIAATADQSSGIQWYDGDYISTGATGTAIGTGLTNTNAIIAAQGSGSYAASIARDYNGGGYTDWFLPSKDELNFLYVNSGVISDINYYNYYWSSTELDSSFAWGQYFYDGKQGFEYKNVAYSVRAVRAF